MIFSSEMSTLQKAFPIFHESSFVLELLRSRFCPKVSIRILDSIKCLRNIVREVKHLTFCRYKWHFVVVGTKLTQNAKLVKFEKHNSLLTNI